jgi:hypothetical protein
MRWKGLDDSDEDAKRVFSALGQNDARALAFRLALGDQEDLASLRRSAELGFALAQAWMALEVQGEEMFKFTQLAAAQGERDGSFRACNSASVRVMAVQGTWTRQRKIFCSRANLVM